MKHYQLIINKTGISAFDDFNSLYSDNAINICPLLEKFHINIVYVSDAKNLNFINLKPNDPMANYIEKCRPTAESTYAEIVVNEVVLNNLCLTEQELLAAIAHEIGHIIFYFLEDKSSCSEQLHEELISDMYACRIGLKESLSSLLNKLIQSGLYPNGQKLQMIIRLLNISHNNQL